MSNEIPTQPNNGEYRLRMQIQDKTNTDLQKQLDDLEKLVNEQAITIARLQERLSIFSLAEGALTIVMGAVAAFIGRIGQ